MTVEKPLPDATIDVVSRYFDSRPPEEVTPEYLNNFYDIMPGGNYRDVAKMLKGFGVPDVPLGLKESENSPTRALFSGKRLAQTREQFFASVDDALRATGINLEELARDLSEEVLLLETAAQAGRAENKELARRLEEEARKIKQEVNRKTLPVYVHLRKQGYSHYELVK